MPSSYLKTPRLLSAAGTRQTTCVVPGRCVHLIQGRVCLVPLELGGLRYSLHRIVAICGWCGMPEYAHEMHLLNPNWHGHLLGFPRTLFSVSSSCTEPQKMQNNPLGRIRIPFLTVLSWHSLMSQREQDVGRNGTRHPFQNFVHVFTDGPADDIPSGKVLKYLETCKCM